MKRSIFLTQLDDKGTEKLLKKEFTSDTEVNDFLTQKDEKGELVNPGTFEVRHFINNVPEKATV